MTLYKFHGILQDLIEHAEAGSREDVDFIMAHLVADTTIAITRFVDFALSLVENEEGLFQIEYYLFSGTQIQRNYSSLFFNRRGDWEIVKQAYDLGLIDEIQAYAR